MREGVVMQMVMRMWVGGASETYSSTKTLSLPADGAAVDRGGDYNVVFSWGTDVSRVEEVELAADEDGDQVLEVQRGG